MIVAIDGPAGSGKSTTARGAAERLGYLYIDTGAMYRTVALAGLRRGSDLSEEAVEAYLGDVRIDLVPDGGALRVLLNGEDVTDALRHEDVGAAASRVARYPAVRRRLVAEQRRIARQHPAGVVLDGRDIGTVVFPEADLKVFLVADDEVRARRRLDELRARGQDARFEDVLADLRRRDRQDRERAHSPLRRADDAVDLDTSRCSIAQQIDFVIEKVEERQRQSAV